MLDPGLLVLQPGVVFHERYRVLRCLAAGGMGAVYEVLDGKTASRRALKVILPNLVEDADARARFALEARVTGGIQSDHLVRITDADVDLGTGLPFLVMDLLEGRDLGAVIAERGRLSQAEVVLHLSQAALALDKTHAAGIVHRDLKPENLFVTRRDDGSLCLKILDFGIAKVVADGARARQTRPLGTPLYMSPEQVEGSGAVGPAADVYALGQIAYTLLVGEAFWMPEAERTLLALLAGIAVGADETAGERALRRRGVRLARGFDAWFGRATARDAAARFGRAGAAVAAFAEAVGEGPVPMEATPADAAVTVPLPSTPWGGRATARSGARAAIVAAAVLVGGGAPALIAFRRWHHAPPPAPALAIDPEPRPAASASGRPPALGPRPPASIEAPPGDTAGAPRDAPGASAVGGAVPSRTAAPRAPARATATARVVRPLKDEGIY